MEKRILILIILTLVLAACGGSPVTPAPTAVPTVVTPTVAAARATPFLIERNGNTIVDMGEYFLTFECIGRGSPAVVLEAGFGGDSSEWSGVRHDIAEFTRVCTYDRAGQGGSIGTFPKPRTSRDVAEDLRALLRAVDIEPPYVLVGHSLGSIHTRVYADLYPGEVAGMVLVDPTHPDTEARFLDALPAPKQGESAELRQLRVDLTSDYDPGTEGLDVRGSFDQVRESGSLGGIPLAVVTAGRVDPPPGIPDTVQQSLGQVWRQLQVELARLSPDSVHVVAKESGPYVQRENAELVVELIRQVVEAVRTGESLPPCGQALERLRGECVAPTRP
jgi:pimeloyl-ACP methyl ester carboxylesterase